MGKDKEFIGHTSHCDKNTKLTANHNLDIDRRKGIHMAKDEQSELDFEPTLTHQQRALQAVGDFMASKGSKKRNR